MMAVITSSAMNTPTSLTVSEAARLIGATPRDISNLFYTRRLRDDLCPLIAGRRMIPREYVETIRDALRRAGRPVREDARQPA